tara:strand:+ start:40 stop:468 length:429 start_codon:yes stop_codon:yes gene_type:complete
MELYCYRAQVLRVIDGDSLSLNVRLGFDVSLKMSVRLYGIDTAETRRVSGGTEDLKALGRFAKQFVSNLLPVGTEVTIRTTLDSKGKFGRVLATVMIDGDEDSLNDFMVAQRLAIPYYGQNKKLTLEQHKMCVAHHRKLGNI